MAQSLVDQTLEDQVLSSSMSSLVTSPDSFSIEESTPWKKYTMNNNYENLDNITFEIIRNKSYPYSSITLYPSASEIYTGTDTWNFNETSTQLINSLNTTASDDIEFYYFYKVIN